MSSSKPKRSKKRSREDEESARRKSVTFAEEISASQGQSAGANSVVRGDADSTVGSRTTITLSSGKWAVVKPSSGAVTASLAKKRLVLFQLPSDVDISVFDGASIELPAASGGNGTLDAGNKGKFSVSAPAHDESTNMRLAVTPDKRSDFASGARLLAPVFSSHMVVSSSKHEVCRGNSSQVTAVPVATAIGSLDPVAVPQLGRLPSIAQASHMRGYFTPAGSSGASATSQSAAPKARLASPSPPQDSKPAARSAKKDKKSKKDKKKKRKSESGDE